MLASCKDDLLSVGDDTAERSFSWLVFASFTADCNELVLDTTSVTSTNILNNQLL